MPLVSTTPTGSSCTKDRIKMKKRDKRYNETLPLHTKESYPDSILQVGRGRLENRRAVNNESFDLKESLMPNGLGGIESKGKRARQEHSCVEKQKKKAKSNISVQESTKDESESPSTSTSEEVDQRSIFGKGWDEEAREKLDLSEEDIRIFKDWYDPKEVKTMYGFLSKTSIKKSGIMKILRPRLSEEDWELRDAKAIIYTEALEHGLADLMTTPFKMKKLCEEFKKKLGMISDGSSISGRKNGGSRKGPTTRGKKCFVSDNEAKELGITRGQVEKYDTWLKQNKEWNRNGRDTLRGIVGLVRKKLNFDKVSTHGIRALVYTEACRLGIENYIDGQRLRPLFKAFNKTISSDRQVEPDVLTAYKDPNSNVSRTTTEHESTDGGNDPGEINDNDVGVSRSTNIASTEEHSGKQDNRLQSELRDGGRQCAQGTGASDEENLAGHVNAQVGGDEVEIDEESCMPRCLTIEPLTRSESIIVDNNETVAICMYAGDDGLVGKTEESSSLIEALPKMGVFLFTDCKPFKIINMSQVTTAKVWVVRLDFRADMEYRDKKIDIVPGGSPGWIRSTEAKRVLLICVTPNTNKMVLQEESSSSKCCPMTPGKIYVLPIGKKFKVSNDELDSPLKLRIIRAKKEQ